MTTPGQDSADQRRPGSRSAILVLRGRASDPLLRSAHSLVVNAILSAALGMTFWVVAARLYPTDSVGRDSALIAAMLQISTVAQLNMSNALVRFMPGYVGAGK